MMHKVNDWRTDIRREYGVVTEEELSEVLVGEYVKIIKNELKSQIEISQTAQGRQLPEALRRVAAELQEWRG